MRDTIFQAILAYLKTCSLFQGEDGTVRVYDFPDTAPSGYPYVVLGSNSLESSVLDNASDMRRYNYLVQIVGEKFGVEGGLTQSQALAAMRATEDAVCAIFDGHYVLGLGGSVTRTMPTSSTWGTTDSNSRIILNINIQVDARVLITL